MGNCCDCANERQNAREAYGIYPEKRLSLLRTDDTIHEDSHEGKVDETASATQKVKGDKVEKITENKYKTYVEFPAYCKINIEVDKLGCVRSDKSMRGSFYEFGISREEQRILRPSSSIKDIEDIEELAELSETSSTHASTF